MILRDRSFIFGTRKILDRLRDIPTIVCDVTTLRVIESETDHLPSPEVQELVANVALEKWKSEIAQSEDWAYYVGVECCKQLLSICEKQLEVPQE
jgi:hypothetical protein